jgi:hypothetical protein
MLALESTRGSVTTRLSSAAIDTGVLVGRAPKCNAALRNLLHAGISRVHLLLRRGVAYDLASTQGTFVSGKRVRSAVVTEGMELVLGSVNPVRLKVQAEGP